MKICSRHFQPEDLVKAIGGQRVYMKAGVVPSRFSWSKDSPKKRKPPKSRALLYKTVFPNTELQVSQATSATETTAETKDLWSLMQL